MKVWVLGLFIVFSVACVSVENRKGSPEEIASVNLKLARSYYSKAQYDIAEEKLDKALNAEPDNIAANALLALVYNQQDKKDRAQGQFEKALDLAEQNSVEFAEINNNFAIFLCKNDNWPEAESHFKAAIEVTDYKARAGALENAGLCALQAEDYSKAEHYFELALKENSHMARSTLGLAKVKAQINDWSTVKSLIQTLHQRIKASEEGLYMLVLAERNLNNNAAAHDYQDQLNNMFPDSEYLKLLN